MHGTSRAPQELPTGAAGEEHSPEQPQVDDSFATLGERAQQIYIELYEMETLSPDELQRIVDDYWENDELTFDEAGTIVRLVKANKVLSKK